MIRRAIPSLKAAALRQPSRRLGLELGAGVLAVALLWPLQKVLAAAVQRGPVLFGDLEVYRRYALAWQPTAPLRHLPVEYPPFSIAIFKLPQLLPVGYRGAFGLFAGAAFLAGLLVVRTRSARNAWAYLAYLSIAGAATMLARYDIFPAVLALAAVWCCSRARFKASYGLVLAASLLKFFPIVLIPVIAIEQWRRTGSWRQPLAMSAGTTCLTVAGLTIPYLLGGTGGDPWWSYQLGRPIQVETSLASVMWLSNQLFGTPLEIAAGKWSAVTGALSQPLMLASFLGLIAGCFFAYWRQLRGELTPERAALAALGFVLLTGKVLSPQYLIWILPTAALVDGVSVLWAAIAMLTLLDYPFLFVGQLYKPLILGVGSLPALPMVVLLLRNLLLGVATFRALLAGAPWLRRVYAPHRSAETRVLR